MTSSEDYQAIPIGTGNVGFKPERHGKSRFSSLLHLSPPKALVIATTIVCITFATVHFYGNPLKQTVHEMKYGLPLSRSQPQPLQTVRGDYCASLREKPYICEEYGDMYGHACDLCGLARQTGIKLRPRPRPPPRFPKTGIKLQPRPRPPPRFPKLQRDEDIYCTFLKIQPYLCHDFEYVYTCEKCGIDVGR